MSAKKRTGPAKAKSPRRAYTTPERAASLAVLAACDGDFAAASRQTGIPRNTLIDWAKRPAAKDGSHDRHPLPSPRPSPKKEPSVTSSVSRPSPSVAAEAQALAPSACSLLADKMEPIVHKITGRLEEKIERANLSQCAIAIGVLIDKIRLLREQSTQNVAGQVRVVFIEVPTDVTSEVADNKAA